MQNVAATQCQVDFYDGDLHKPFDAESRYSGHQFVHVAVGNRSYRTIETWEAPARPPVMERGSRYFYVRLGDSHRPDRIAATAFGTWAYWWWLMYSNNLYDPLQLVPGVTLQINRPGSETPRAKKPGAV